MQTSKHASAGTAATTIAAALFTLLGCGQSADQERGEKAVATAQKRMAEREQAKQAEAQKAEAARQEEARKDHEQQMALAKKEHAAFLAGPAGRLCAKHPGWSEDACEAIVKRKAAIGMTDEQVRLAWGKPDHINTTITGSTRHEQWVWGTSQYAYFDDGVLRSVQQSK